MNRICNRDCLNCLYLDCEVDGITLDECQEISERDNNLKLLNSPASIKERQRKLKTKARIKVYYKNNKDKLIAYQKKWHANNKNKIQTRRKELYLANKEKFDVYQKAYYIANKPKISAYKQAWYAAKKQQNNMPVTEIKT